MGVKVFEALIDSQGGDPALTITSFDHEQLRCA
jgi:hypothetical protein